MQNMIWQMAVAFGLVGILAGCSAEPETPQQQAPAQEGGKATGKVLGGSISDDMIPLESLTSQSPPLKQQRSTTVATTVSQDGSNVETVVETVTSNSDGAEQSLTPALTPAPPLSPATPDGE